MANLGNLGLKSSPLAPTSSKLTTQYMVLDHMTNHFRKVTKAKSAIDNKPPKSLQTSQKMRDRRNRTRIMKSPLSRPDHSMRNDEMQQYQDILNEEPEDEDDRLVHSIMRSALNDKPSNYATYGSRSENTYHPTDQVSHSMDVTHTLYNGDSVYRNRPSSARSVQSARSVTSRTPITHDLNRVTYKGDILQTRSHIFTEAAPFTPRTNKRDAVSKLKNYVGYNPPRARRGQKQAELEEEPQPRPAPKGRKSKKVTSDQSDHNFQEGVDTAQLTETMLMDMSIRSRADHSSTENTDHQIPRLDISMDRDHMNWLQEQASKAKVRAKSGAKLPVAEEAIPEEPSTLSQSGGLNRSLKMEAREKEQEQKYLTFAQEVTDDVLANGISSERVMQRIFENHIEKRKNDLDETRMRKVIKDLRVDLGLKDHLSDHGSLGSQLNNNNSDSRRRPGSSGKSSHAGSVQRTGSEKSYSKADDLDQSSSQMGETLEPIHQQEQDMSTTLESTSTMQFAGTREMFSTINSEASREAREALMEDENGGGDELSTTQALKQYQMTLTAKEDGVEEVSESGLETTMASSVGAETDVSEKSHKLERPATGERRTEDDQKSDTSSVKAAQNGSSSGNSKPRSRRRDRLMKTKATEELSSTNGNLASSETLEGHNGQSALSSSQNTINGLSKKGGSSAAVPAQKDLVPPEAMDDAESVKSSSSNRPVAKPRVSARSKPEPSTPPAEERGGQEEVSESKQDSSLPTDSGVASGHHKAEHDDTQEETSEVDKQGPEEDMEEDYEDDYEDDYDADEDDGQDASTHRTSEDAF